MNTASQMPPIDEVDEVSSTLDALAERHRHDPSLPTWTTILARHQWAGRGRQGRGWVDAGRPARRGTTTPDDEAASLLLATLVRVDDHHLAWTSAHTGLAFVDALAEAGIHAHLKWPNDVLLHDRKVAGILITHLDSAEVDGRTVHTLAVGLGANIGTAPAGAGPRAGAIPMRGRAADDVRRDLAHSLRLHLARRLGARSRHATRDEYRSRLAHIGRTVTVHAPDGSDVTGQCLDVDADARLVLATRTGVVRVSVGDLDTSPCSASQKEHR